VRSCQHQHHDRQGLAFGVFRKVFGAAKVARLHTRLAPHRCDPNAYLQLIYAACLSLLKQSSIPKHQPDDTNANANANANANNTNQNNDKDDVVNFNDAAYAVFCLYALYETNPLPQGHPDDDDKSSRLAMLSNRENPKLLFRRAFRSNIRIDQAHYLYLLTLRDLALSKTADCRSNGFGTPTRLSSDSDSDSDSPTRDTRLPLNHRNCHCAIAEDTVQVIGRLWK
jgi:hypothetical protein